MYDILAALNAALLPMSAIFLWFFIEYQYRSRGDDQSDPVNIFGWSLFCLCVGMFFSSVLYFLWDFDVIYKSTQYKLSVIPRGFFVAGLTLGFHALQVKWRKIVFIIALSLFLGVLIARVLW